jgi:hypothetical protein
MRIARQVTCALAAVALVITFNVVFSPAPGLLFGFAIVIGMMAAAIANAR